MEGNEPAREAGGLLPLPFAIPLVVCDAASVDFVTGKTTLHGCFGAIYSREFPVVHPSLVVYTLMANGRGRVDVAIRLIDSDEQRDPIFEVSQVIEFPSPLVTMEFKVGVTMIVFPESGEYRLQLLANGQ